MHFLNMPDYLSANSFTGLEFVLQLFWFVIYLYFSLFLCILMNTIIILSVSYSLLIVYRTLGIPWIDGTTKGIFNRS